MKILAISDSHVCGPPSSWSALFDKRVVGLFNYHYIRKQQHNQRWLKKAVEYILQNPPDLVICGGDICTGAEPSEFEYSYNILKPLINNTGFDFFYIPGNHDYYVKNKECTEAFKSTFAKLNGRAFNFKDLPYFKTMGGIDFCFVNESFPTFLILSSGYMTPYTKNKILNWLDNKSGNPKVLVGHYPLDEGQPIMRARHKLWGHNAILKKLKNKDLDLSICGHVHEPEANIDETGRGEIIIGSITKNGSITSIEYDEKENNFDYNMIQLTSDN